jgi:hypothetical protein
MAEKLNPANVINLSNAIGMLIIPYTVQGGSLVVGTDTYDVTEIVADTVSITPDDNEVNTTDAEFRDTPLFENVTLGKVQFAATCTDFQNEMMKGIFGWTEYQAGTGTDPKAVLAPLTYQDLWCAIVVKFSNRYVLLPKVKMNSKAVLATLKTGYGEGQLAGTAYAGYINFDDASTATPTAAKTKQTTWGFIPASNGTASMDYRFLASMPES